MDLKLLHMFTLPGGKQGRRSAGRTHVLTLYTNIIHLPFQILTFIALHPWCLSCAVLDCVKNISIFPHSPRGRSSHVLTGEFRAPGEGTKPAAPPSPKGSVTGLYSEPFHHSMRDMAFKNNNDYVHFVPC